MFLSWSMLLPFKFVFNSMSRVDSKKLNRQKNSNDKFLHIMHVLEDNVQETEHCYDSYPIHQNLSRQGKDRNLTRQTFTVLGFCECRLHFGFWWILAAVSIWERRVFYDATVYTVSIQTSKWREFLYKRFHCWYIYIYKFTFTHITIAWYQLWNKMKIMILNLEVIKSNLKEGWYSQESLRVFLCSFN